MILVSVSVQIGQVVTVTFIDKMCMSVAETLTTLFGCVRVGRKYPQKLTQFSPRSHPRHLVGKRTAQHKIPAKTSQATAR